MHYLQIDNGIEKDKETEISPRDQGQTYKTKYLYLQSKNRQLKMTKKCC